MTIYVRSDAKLGYSKDSLETVLQRTTTIEIIDNLRQDTVRESPSRH